MTTVPQESPTSGRRPWSTRLQVPDMWPSLAIAVMWLAVLCDALWGPNIVSSNASATSATSIPSAVVLALFAWLATRAVARYGLRKWED